jgi:hypothetical protein
MVDEGIGNKAVLSEYMRQSEFQFRSTLFLAGDRSKIAA